jgi:hypothetical protein
MNARWLYLWPLALVVWALYLIATPAHRREHGDS